MNPELIHGLLFAGFFAFGLVATMLAENVLLPRLAGKNAPVSEPKKVPAGSAGRTVGAPPQVRKPTK